MDETLPGPVIQIGGRSGTVDDDLPVNDAANTAAPAGGIADNGNAASGDEGRVETPRVPRKCPMKVFGDRRHAINQRKWLNKRSARGLGEKQELEFEAVLREYFDFLDPEGTGAISVEELEEPLLSLGVVNSHSDVCALISLVDADGTGVIEFPDFVRIVKSGDRVREVLQAMAHGDVGCRDLNFDISVAQYRRQQMMSALVLDGTDAEQAGEKERAHKHFQNWVRFLERHDKLPDPTLRHRRLFGGLQAAAELEAPKARAAAELEVTSEKSREMVSLRRKYARRRQKTTTDLPPVVQRRQMAAFCSAHFSTLSLIFHAMIPDLNVEQHVIGRREFQTALRQLAVADVHECPVQLTAGMISALWSMLDAAHCSVTCLSALEKGLARVAGSEVLTLPWKQEEKQEEERLAIEQEEQVGEQAGELLLEGAETPSLGLSSIHSSFFDSPNADGAGTPSSKDGLVEEMQERLCKNAFSSHNSAGARSAQSAVALSSMGQGEDPSRRGSLPDEDDDGPPFRRAMELADQGLGCATKLVRDRQWHRTNFKGVDEVLLARAPAAPWLYQTSTKPPDSGHFMQADFLPLEMAAESSRKAAAASREVNSTAVAMTSTSQSSLGALPKKFNPDKSIGEESTRSTVGQGVAELQAALEEPWFTSDPAVLKGKLKLPRQTKQRPGARSSALRSAARSLIMTPRSK